MAASERDVTPMLSSVDSQVDEQYDSQIRRFTSRTRSTSMSIPMNSAEYYDKGNSFVSYTGPLRNEKQTELVQMSGPLFVGRRNENGFRHTQGALGRKTTENAVDRYPSLNGMGQNVWPDNSYAVKNDHLLNSGQLGMCNDPYCTTCPSYYRVKGPQKKSKSSDIFDQKFHNMLNGDAKGWAKKISSFFSPYIPPVMNPHAKVVQQWNKFFVISCLFAVFLDPLFFFLLYVQQDNKCIVLNWPMTTTIVFLRSMTDLVYLIHILLQFRLAYVAPESRVVGAGDLVDNPKKIALHYLSGCFIIDFFVVLPLPQLIILVILPDSMGSSGANYAKNLLRAAILVQYIPRLYRFLPLLAGQSPSGFVFESAWANFVINLLTFMLSSHVVGSCWYLLGLQWQIKDARVMTWILGSVDPAIVLNLRPYKTAKSMWEYLKKVYYQDNTARRSQLEYEIASYTQGNLSIQDYFSGFNNLWEEFTDIIYAKVPEESLAVVQELHAQSKRDQFLMKLRPEFESTRSNLMNRYPMPSLDVCFGELLREEQRLATQATYQHDNMTPNALAHVAQAKGKGRDMRKVQCFSCKEYGHIATNCTRKFCNYCKKPGHIIKECPTRPQNRQANAYQATVGSTSSPPTSDSSVLTTEKVQQMIISAFSALGLQGNSSLSSSWIIDSGASNHMTSSSETLSNVRTYTGSAHIQIANGSQLPIHAIGDVNSTVRDVFVSPQLSTSLISVGQLVDNNCDVRFSRNGSLVQDQVSGKILAKGPKVGRLFPLHFSIPGVISFACNTVNNKCEVWHKRLGHPNSVILSYVINSGLLGNKDQFSSSLSFDCSPCKLGKSKSLSFPSHGSHAERCFDLIHSDVWGISPVISHANYKYFVTFIDDYTKYTWIYFLRAKSEVLSVFQQFTAYVENQFSSSIKILRSDSGGEYMSQEFHIFLQQKGIVSQRSCPYTPQQNGVAERKNRHLLDVVRTLLLQSSVPPKFWVEALSTAVYLINRLPSSVLNFETPYFRLYHQHPRYVDMHTFGCVCFVHLPSHERHKLSAQSVRCAFMGYSTSHKGYVCYDPNSNRFRISRHVVFFENQSFFPSHNESLPEMSILPNFDDLTPSIDRFKPGLVYERRRPTLPLPESGPPSEPVQIESSTNDMDTTPVPRRSTRVSRPPDRYGFSHTSLHVTLSSIPIPSGYSEAAKHDCWRAAMDEELRALQDNHTWDVVPCPAQVKPIGCKWVYSIKLRSDGTLDRYKARLVALGNRQEYGVDYEETFAPVAKMTTVRTIMSVAASQGWPLHQMDVKNAFLHGDLKEEIYMTIPPGLSSYSSSDVCKLKRSLYGLKQAPRAWFDKFRSTLLQFSFKQSAYDSSLFFCKTSLGIVLLLVYVDDIVITGTDSTLITQLQQHLQASFHMKDLGPLTYFLGLEVHNTSSGIFLNQHKYAQDLIALAGLHDTSSVDTPMEVNTKYRREEGDLLSDPTMYRQLVGSLNYLTITRPDISFAVQQVSQFMQAPRHLHLAAVRRIIRYLRGSPSRGLFFPNGTPLKLVAYSDADWAGCPDTRRSVTGWCMFLGDSLISWKSKKQDRVSKSSTESEYRAMSAACSEILWLRGLLAEIGFVQSDPTPLHADNTSAIQIAANPVFHERTKHIEVDCHFIREVFDSRIISLPHISTELQIADVFTKAMTRQRHQFFVSKLMLLDLPASI